MDSETNIIQVNQTGTMDDKSIRQEICDVMEGTKDAFEMRAKNIILISRNNFCCTYENLILQYST